MTPATWRKALKAEHRAARTPFFHAVAADVVAFCANRGEREQVPTTKWGRWRAVARLTWQSDDFLGLFLYRVRVALFDRGVPIIPRLLHLICRQVWGLRIGDFVLLEGGVYVPHGQIVIDGIVKVGHGSVLRPWITLGLVHGGIVGPTLAERVSVGTGAKILGDVKIGAFAKIGANAVVVADVPAGATAIGVPARVIENGSTAK